MQVVTVSGEERSDLSRRTLKKLRTEGHIPAVLYGKGGNVHFTTKINQVKSLVYTPDFKLAEVDLGKGGVKCILKDIQFHPVSDEIVHIDFLELTDGVSIKLNLPVTFEGVSPGVKNGGKFIKALRTVKVKTTPEKMVDKLVADISELKLGSAVRVGELNPVEGVEVITNGSIPIATVEVPRALKSADEEEGAAIVGEGEEQTEESAEA